MENLAQGIWDLIRTDPETASIAGQVLAAVSQISRRARQRSDLNGPQRYLEILCSLLTSPIFSYSGRPNGPDSAGVAHRRDEWKWPYRQVRGTFFGNACEISGDAFTGWLSVGSPCISPLGPPGDWFRCTRLRFRVERSTTTGLWARRRTRIYKCENPIAPNFAVRTVITVVIYDGGPRPIGHSWGGEARG